MRGSFFFSVLLAGVSALVGLLVFHVAGWNTDARGAGWGMCIGGALAGFAAAGSGSPSDRLAAGRSGFFGTYWGQSAALPLTPLWVIVDALAVFAAGIAVIVLA